MARAGRAARQGRPNRALEFRVAFTCCAMSGVERLFVGIPESTNSRREKKASAASRRRCRPPRRRRRRSPSGYSCRATRRRCSRPFTRWRNSHNARILLESSPTVGVACTVHLVRGGAGFPRRSPARADAPARSYPRGPRNSVPRTPKTAVSVQENHAEASLRRRVARRRRGRLAAARHLLRQPAVPPEAERHCVQPLLALC